MAPGYKHTLRIRNAYCSSTTMVKCPYVTFIRTSPFLFLIQDWDLCNLCCRLGINENIAVYKAVLLSLSRVQFPNNFDQTLLFCSRGTQTYWDGQEKLQLHKTPRLRNDGQKRLNVKVRPTAESNMMQRSRSTQ
jgi:hypothetical protein